MFRTSIVHIQERSYAVCCNMVRLDTSSYEGEGRTAVLPSSPITTGRIETYKLQHTTQERS